MLVHQRVVVVFVEPCSSTIISKIAALAMTYRHLRSFLVNDHHQDHWSTYWFRHHPFIHIQCYNIYCNIYYNIIYIYTYCQKYIYIYIYNDNVTYFLRNFCSTWYLCGMFWFKAGFFPFTSCPKQNGRWWAATWLGAPGWCSWSTWSTNWMVTMAALLTLVII